ncbi:DUF3261 domain-containing protein [Treponema sp.]|uniref:DUF3261 domain-containing protein n=1 Tax=Treponema sp. TaxID=166 RepID=UPI0025F6F6F7|nr:DUF3261 domain-containing protein [Treponema sp.]MCR5218041.1 DUF3261 domain-containing protein [Treponema sp.]
MAMLKKIFFIFAVSIFTGIFAGCTSSGLNKVYVTNTKKVSLLPPSSMMGETECYEYFSGNFGDQSFAMTCYFSSDNDGITILLLNDFGVQMGTMTYDGVTAALDSSVLPSSFKCEYILLDIQNAYYNKDKLIEHYKNHKLIFNEETKEDGSIVRKVMNKKDLIEEITIKDKTIVIKNYLRGYEYEITGADDE